MSSTSATSSRRGLPGVRRELHPDLSQLHAPVGHEVIDQAAAFHTTIVSSEYGSATIARASRQTVNELLRERRSLSPEMALRLARLFGNSAEFWLNAQRAVDLWDAERAIGAEVERIKALKVT